MRKYILLLLISITTMTASLAQESIYDFTVKDITGEDFDFSDLKGKKLLIVNTASKCGFTPQFEDLEKLYKEFGGDDFTVIGFPSNDFAKQDPGTNKAIAAFCKKNYGVTFPMMSKIKVKGDDKHPLYEWLTEKDLNEVENSSVAWNFQKYMISEKGELLGHIASRKGPYTEEITDWLTD